MGILILVSLTIGRIDTIGVLQFESEEIEAKKMYEFTFKVRENLKNKLYVYSKEELGKLGVIGEEWGKVLTICKERTVPFLLKGEVKYKNDRYFITFKVIDFKKEREKTFHLVTDDLQEETIERISCGVVNFVFHQEDKKLGSIKFESQPEGAEVLLDGKYVGKTPLQVDLIPLGEHSVLLAKKGYNTVVKLIVVYPGRVNFVSSKLTPRKGSLIAPPDKLPVYVTDEIVVRGERIKEEIFRTPKGVVVLDRRDIKYSGARNLLELLDQVSGISIVERTGSGVDGMVSIRGMDPSKYTIVMVDGIVVNRLDGGVSWETIPLPVVKRIEIIKGEPFSPVGGKAGGGIINIITEEKGLNKITLSSTNGKDIGWNGVIYGEKEWSLWLNATGRKGVGWREGEEYDIKGGYGKLSFPMKGKKKLIFSIDAGEQKITLPGGLTEEELKENPKQKGEDEEKKEISHLRIASTYLSQGEQGREVKMTNTLMPEKYKIMKKKEEGWELSGIETGIKLEYRRRGMEFSSELVGVIGKREEMWEEGIVKKRENSYQLIWNNFLEWKRELFNWITFRSGVSYQLIGYWVREFMGEESEEFTEGRLTPRIGVLAPLRVGELFLSIEQKIIPPKVYEKARNLYLVPEVTTSFECGGRWRVGVFNVSGAVFLNYIENEILTKGLEFENSAEEIIHRGVEGELAFRLSELVSFFATYTYIKAQFEQSKKEVPEIRECDGSVGVRFTYLPTYSIVITYNYYGKGYVDKEYPEVYLPPYERLDFCFKFTPFPNFSVNVLCTNFTEEKGKRFGYIKNGKPYYYPLEPIGFKVEVGLEF